MIYISFFSILISMLLIDGVWLSLMLKRLYAPNIGHLLGETPSIPPAIIFYILYAFCLNVFVVLPALRNNTSYLDLLMMGFLFGIATYGTYDLTNQVTLKNWPWVVTMVDMAWGGCLTASISLISTFVTRYFI